MNLDENYHTIIATYTFERNKMTFRVTCREPSGASVSAETSSPIKFERDYVAILAEASQIVKRNESGGGCIASLKKQKMFYKIDGNVLTVINRDTGTKTPFTRVK